MSFTTPTPSVRCLRSSRRFWSYIVLLGALPLVQVSSHLFANLSSVILRFARVFRFFAATQLNFDQTTKIAALLFSGRTFFKNHRFNDSCLRGTGVLLAAAMIPTLWEIWWLIIMLSLFSALLYLFYRLKIKGVKIEQKRLETLIVKRAKQLEQKEDELEKIDTIIKSINAAVDPVELLEAILEETFSIKSIKRATGLVYDKSLNAYKFKVSLGGDIQELQQAQLSLEEFEERYITHATEMYPGIFLIRPQPDKSDEQAETGLSELAKTQLIIKINIEHNVIGFLIFENTQKEDAFDDHEIQILKRLRDHIASAFIKSKLLLELQSTIASLEQTNKKLEELSSTDPLTGLKNRRYASKFIQDTVAKVRRDYYQNKDAKTDQRPANSDIVFLMLDLDHFKSVNDSYGHKAGDLVLMQLRDIFESIFRETDLLVRWGGEEFLIVNRFSNQQYAPIIAERVRKKVEEYPFDIGNHRTVNLTCSIGSGCYPFVASYPDCLNWEQVVAIADKALYVAKISGRNAWVNIVSTATTKPEKLFDKIQFDMESLIKANELEVYTSIFGHESSSPIDYSMLNHGLTLM